MLLIRKHIKFLLFLILPAYFLVLGNSIANRHIHILPNGSVVTHAHPFINDNTSEDKTKHGHTKAEFIFFQLTTIDFFEVSTPLVLSNVYQVFVVSFEIPLNCFYTFLQFNNKLSPRAPPV